MLGQWAVDLEKKGSIALLLALLDGVCYEALARALSLRAKSLMVAAGGPQGRRLHGARWLAPGAGARTFPPTCACGHARYAYAGTCMFMQAGRPPPPP